MPTLEEARQWYQAQDLVHGFDHVLRVLNLAERLGGALGADMEILRAAALLHDAADAHPAQGGGRLSHEQASAEFASEVLRKEGWEPDRIAAVQHCIRAHRFRGSEAPSSLEAKILFDADKLDVIGAFGTARTIGYAVQAGQPLYARPSRSFLEEGQRDQGEPHSAYHEYLFKLRHIRNRLHTPLAREWARGRHALMEAFFEQLAAEAEV